MSTNNEKTVKIGTPYAITLTTGAVVSGILFYKGEDLSNGNLVKQYGLLLDETLKIYLRDCQIVKMKEIYPIDTAYFESLENEYDVRCFDSDGELLPASRILGNIIYRDNNLEKLSKKERKDLIKHLYFTNKDIIDVVEAFLVEKKDNKKAHDDKLKILDATSELVDNYDRIMNKRPYAKSVYDLIFKELGVEKFIKQICRK